MSVGHVTITFSKFCAESSSKTILQNRLIFREVTDTSRVSFLTHTVNDAQDIFSVFQVNLRSEIVPAFFSPAFSYPGINLVPHFPVVLVVRSDFGPSFLVYPKINRTIKTTTDQPVQNVLK